MGRKTLAIKYRPKTFSDIVGQNETAIILKSQVDNNNFKNCYLFTGKAGTGKTTAARILANGINKSEGQYIEIDAATHNGVDHMRELIEESRFVSITANYKVYIIDECHMLSIGAWNAMLKMLEEPPEKTIFILCTTDMQKVPLTILSRVQIFNFKSISRNDIFARLEKIILNEGIEGVNDDALMFISTIAYGGMRDALSILEKCLSLNDGLTIEMVQKTLGFVAFDLYFNLTDAILNKSFKDAVKIITICFDDGLDLNLFAKAYFYFLIDIMVYNATKDIGRLLIPEVYLKWVDDYLTGDEKTNNLKTFEIATIKIQNYLNNKTNTLIPKYALIGLFLDIIEE